MRINKLHALFLQSNGVFTDTRKIQKGAIFFALKGENFDGNKFAIQAVKNGAAFAVVDTVFQAQEKIIEVANVLECLQNLATFHRRYVKVPVIALTGSNGKTTSKQLLFEVLSKKFRTTATQGNLNNHIGVPLTLLSMDRDTEIGIVEMGANHPGEIAFLCEITQPDYGYITNFGKAHLEGFGGLEGVIKAKSELYDFLRKHDKTIFVNSDDTIQIEQSAGGEIYGFGEDSSADCRVEFLKADPFVEIGFDGLNIKSQLIGTYNAKNISAAVGIGNFFGVKSEDIKEAIENYVPMNNRSQIIEQNQPDGKAVGNKIVLDAYNANPTSMAAALESFHTMKSQRKILVLGDMFELGENSQIEHQAVVETIEGYDFDAVYLCGKNFYQTKSKSSNIKWFQTFEALKNELEKTKFSKAFILIKGSRGMALERILESI